MNLLRLCAPGLLLASLLARPAAAQVLDPSFASPTGLYAPGQVFALGPQQADGKRLVAGYFTRANNAPASSLVRLDATGALDLPFLQNVGIADNIYRIQGLPSGQYLLGAYGGSVTAGGLVLTELLRLNANGTADASFNPGSGPNGGFGYVQEYGVQPDGKVVVVGPFDTYSGVPAQGVVRLNANGSVDPGFSVGTGIDVNAPNYDIGNAVAVQPDGKILVGGNFNTFGGQPAPGLVRLGTGGGVDPAFTPFFQLSSYVDGVVLQPDGKILVNGNLQLPNGTSTSLVRLLPSGAQDGSFTLPGNLNDVYSFIQGPAVVLQPDGKMVITGNFNAPGARHVARLNANGTQDFTFQNNNGPSATPFTVGVDANGSVLVGGGSGDFNGVETPIGRLTPTGAPDAAFAPKLQLPGTVLALLLQPDGRVVLGGNFTELSGQPVHRLVRLSATGAVETSFVAAAGVLPDAVNALALQPDGKILVGGAGVSRYAATGSPDPSFATNVFVGNTTALAVQPDGRILVGGFFSGNAGGVAYSRLARLTSTGAFDATFARPVAGTTGVGAPNATDALLVQPDGKIVVGGTFQLNGQAPVGRVVRYETTGAPDAAFSPPTLTAANGSSNARTRLYGLARQPDGKIVVGGNFGAVNGALHYGVARLAATGAPDAAFAPSAPLNGIVFALARQPNGRVLLGGSFSTAGTPATLSNLARVLDDGQTDATFGSYTNPNGAVRGLAVQPDGGIVLAGGFTTVGGQPAAGVARIIAANVLAVAAPAAVAARTAAWPVPPTTACAWPWTRPPGR